MSNPAPLAARMRPQSLAEYRGQAHLLAEGQALRTALDSGQLHSMIFWGPPGVGKTTLARLLAQHSDAH
ncbi:MAG: AAA family ATPase, partial [Spongiibacter marinus]|uniref:AAA family ATPase n=1 Tax=Spongiibacter marinus TaxID=354246 RepID=UPI003C34A932